MKLLGTKELETERLILRKIKIKDADEAYNNWCSHDEVSRYVPWDTHTSVEVTKTLYASWIKDYEDPSTFRWIVELKDTHELIGTIDVSSKEYIQFGTVEIGYCYGPKYWGYGYATEALKKVMEYLFIECEAETIHAKHMSNNPGSGKVMAKSGLIYEGIQRSRLCDKLGIRNDIVSYSLTRSEYMKTK